ncbi:MAG: CHASE2 domain-containing protein, partial [Pirellulales bacterium]
MPHPTANFDAVLAAARRVSPAGTVVLATALIWLVGVAGTGNRLDGWIHDYLVRGSIEWSHEHPRVLLVYANRRFAREVPDWLARVAEKLSAAGATRVGIVIPAGDIPLHMIEQFTETDNVFLGRDVFWERDDPRNAYHFVDGGRPGVLSDRTGQRDDAQTGSLALLPSRAGVVRNHYGKGSGDRPWSFEAIIARSLIGDVQQIPDGHFEVWFHGGVDSLPHIGADRVLADGVIPELVTGKVALIGYSPSSLSPGIVTPTTQGDRMSLIEFHGHVLNTILTDAAIVGVGRLSLLAVMLVTGLCGCVLYRRFDAAYLLPLLLCTGVVIVAAAFTLLVGWHVRLPVVSLAALQFAALAVVVAYRYRLARLALMGLLIQRSTYTRVMRAPGVSSSLDGTWDQLAELIDQLFYIERMVVFELAPGSQHLVPVRTVHCQTEDLGERRRDYRRVPFVDALDANGPIRVDHTQFRFFKSSHEGDTQFLAPITFEGTLLGFLATDIAADALADCPDFAQALRRVADETAAVLAYQRAKQQSLQRNRWLGLLTQVPEQPLVAELERTSRSLEHRLGYLEQVFEASASPSSVYDLFGKTMLINVGMRRVLERRGLELGDVRASDLLSELSRRNVQECRHVMRCVILDRHEQIVSVTIGHAEQWQLHVRPLASDAATAIRADDVPQPFQVQGVHFELVAGTVKSAPSRPMEKERDPLCKSLDSTLDQLSDAADYLAGTDEEHDERETHGAHGEREAQPEDEQPVTVNVVNP